MAGSLTFLFQATHLIQNAFAVFRFFFLLPYGILLSEQEVMNEEQQRSLRRTERLLCM